MGVEHETYLILGYRLTPNLPEISEHLRDKFDSNKKGELIILIDGMGGEYTVAGLILEVGDFGDYLPILNLTKIGEELVSLQNDAMTKVSSWAHEIGIDQYFSPETQRPCLLLINHFH